MGIIRLFRTGPLTQYFTRTILREVHGCISTYHTDFNHPAIPSHIWCNKIKINYCHLAVRLKKNGNHFITSRHCSHCHSSQRITWYALGLVYTMLLDRNGVRITCALGWTQWRHVMSSASCTHKHKYKYTYSLIKSNNNTNEPSWTAIQQEYS